MMRKAVFGMICTALAGCGVDGEPSPPVEPHVNAGVSIGSSGVYPSANVGISQGPYRSTSVWGTGPGAGGDTRGLPFSGRGGRPFGLYRPAAARAGAGGRGTGARRLRFGLCALRRRLGVLTCG